MTIAVPKTVRYIIAGCTGAAVNIGTLFVLTHFFGVWYLASSVAAFIVAFFISFYLQRTWTFQQGGWDSIHRHAALYLVATLFNLGLNTLIVYVSVESFHLWYLLAQIVAGAIVAVFSYFVYKHLIFMTPRDAV
jgi:putative flippase GtrA